MGFMDELKKLTHPYSEPEEDDYDDYDDEPLDNDPAPAPQSSRRSYSRSTPAAQDTQTTRGGNKVVNINATTQLQVVLVKPDRFDLVSDIADHLRDKQAVVHEQGRRPPSGGLPLRLRLCARRQDQEDRHFHLSHHAVQRGCRWRSR